MSQIARGVGGIMKQQFKHISHVEASTCPTSSGLLTPAAALEGALPKLRNASLPALFHTYRVDCGLTCSYSPVDRILAMGYSPSFMGPPFARYETPGFAIYRPGVDE